MKKDRDKKRRGVMEIELSDSICLTQTSNIYNLINKQLLFLFWPLKF